MVRLKFAIFAVAVLVLWVWHLYALAPSLSARAVDAASVQAARAPAGIAVKIDERRREFHRAALKVASSPSGLAALRNRAEPPTAEKFVPLKAAALESVPEPYRAGLLIGLANEHGAIYSRGTSDPIADPKDLNIASLAQAGAEGLWQDAFGTTHLFFSFPVAVFDRGEPKLLGSMVLGAPLEVESLLEAAAKEAGVGAIALIQASKVISMAGPEKPPLDKLDRLLSPGKTGVVVRGSIASLGPFRFPVATNSDAFGGKAPLWIGSRQAIRSTPYEVIGFATTRPLMEALAGYQRVALWLFLALLGLSVAVALFIDAPSYRIPPRIQEKYEEREYERPAQEAQSYEPAHQSGFHPAAAGGPVAEVPPVPEDGSERFHSAGSAFPGEPQFEQPPAGDAFTHGAPPSAEPPPPPADGYGAFVEDNQPTTAYPSSLLQNDAFAMASGHPQASTDPPPQEPYPDATRVAEIPEELLRASARPEVEPPPIPKPPSKPPPAQHSLAPNDEQHFREVFREFLTARATCGEPADGLTYDRFAQKLRKNRDQLIEKYNCRTVRFQVYVKEGRAALKATPLKD